MDGVNNYTCFCPPYYTGGVVLGMHEFAVKGAEGD